MLLDARRGITDTDLETMNIFDNIPVSYQLVLTKLDKIKIKDVEILLNNLKKNSDFRPASHPKIHLTSTLLGLGINELKADIASIIEK